MTAQRTGRLLQALRQRTPSTVRHAARRWRATCWRLADAVRRPPSDHLVPPRHLAHFVGGGDFEAQGELHLHFFVKLGGLRPGDHVLDVGCGIGRMALPLTGFLSPDGRYCGFDIVPEGIAWCRAQIAATHPNFQFEVADIHNAMYNPAGTQRARDFRFPHPDGWFDFQFSTSVFTHMLAADLAHYVAEIARVLAPGGRCLNTFFLVNAESTRLIAAGRSTRDIRHPLDGCFTLDRAVPEEAVGYDEAVIRALFARHDLAIVEPIHYGSWCGRSDFVAYQDMIVTEKLDPAARP